MCKIKENERRLYRFEIRLNEIENSKLTYDSLTAGISKSELIRNLILNNVVKQKPNRDLYEIIDNLSKIYIRLTQIVKQGDNNKFIDNEEIKKQAKELSIFVRRIEEIYL